MRYINIKEIEERYKSRQWRSLRKRKLLANPFCERCLKQGIYKAAKIIHHIEYINSDNYMKDEVFLNINNLESLCQECHNKEHFEQQEEYFFNDSGDLIKKEK